MVHVIIGWLRPKGRTVLKQWLRIPTGRPKAKTFFGHLSISPAGGNPSCSEPMYIRVRRFFQRLYPKLFRMSIVSACERCAVVLTFPAVLEKIFRAPPMSRCGIFSAFCRTIPRLTPLGAKLAEAESRELNDIARGAPRPCPHPR